MMLSLICLKNTNTQSEAFIDDGGNFVCWLIGHSHLDNLFKLESYNNQLVIKFPSMAQRAGCLLKNSDISAYNYNCMTYMTVDEYQHTVRFMRIGADIDTTGIKHEGVSLDYTTGELLGAW